MGTARRGDPAASRLEEHLAELARLTDTAGAEVAGRMVQRVAAPTPRFFIGPGKVTQVKALADDTQATLVIFDDDLSPSQGRNLERALERRIMDRSEVILDIFATRARSKEAKLEVELAQLEYLLPRLARMWVHLSRIRGGIGLRGPGETQIETDRRLIRRKISRLRRELERVTRHRHVLRQGRRAIPTVALVGYTNAGKSSLLKALTRADTLVDDRLFATLDTLTREVVLDGGGSGRSGRGGREGRVRLVDTVGFIRKLPHHLVASFGATLEEARDADILAHVIDASHPDWEEQVEVVDGVLAGLGETPPPIVHVFNKMDLVAETEVFRRRVLAGYPEAAFVSAATGETAEFQLRLEALVSPFAKLA
ncbi:MAG: GTPase HflX [Gemmatimonadetes bacterium]|nr:GTPase HflX [Gemmatimonadota bacterium]